MGTFTHFRSGIATPELGTDRFGLRWQIVPVFLGEMMRDEDPARARRVMDSMLEKVELDIAALEKAYRS